MCFGYLHLPYDEHHGDKGEELDLPDLVPMAPGQVRIKRREGGEKHPAGKDQQGDRLTSPRDTLVDLGIQHRQHGDQGDHHGKRKVLGKSPAQLVGIHIGEPGPHQNTDVRLADDEGYCSEDHQQDNDVPYSAYPAQFIAFLLVPPEQSTGGENADTTDGTLCQRSKSVSPIL